MTPQRFAAALAACTALELSGCYLGERHVTYPSPQLPAVIKAELTVSVRGFASLCPQSHSFGITRNAVAFGLEDVQFCFQTPYDGETEVSCVSIFGVPRHGSLRFQVFVSGDGVTLNQPRATLETGERSSTVAAQVRDATYAGGIEEAPAGATPMNPGAKVLLYGIPRQRLIFRFDQPCDPDAHYRLSVAGIVFRGREARVPPVDFDPYSEWTPVFVD